MNEVTTTQTHDYDASHEARMAILESDAEWQRIRDAIDFLRCHGWSTDRLEDRLDELEDIILTTWRDVRDQEEAEASLRGLL